MCSTRLRLCLRQQGQATRWYLRQQGESPGPAHGGGGQEHPGMHPSTERWRGATPGSQLQGSLNIAPALCESQPGDSAEQWDWGRLQDRFMRDLW